MGWHDCELCMAETETAGKIDEATKIDEVNPAKERRGFFARFRRASQTVPTVQYDRESRILRRYGIVIRFGVANLYLPGNGFIYAAPSTIAHYIDKHNYDPPPEFWQAVWNCPEMNSAAYKQALLANGPSDRYWISAVEETEFGDSEPHKYDP